MAWIEICTRLLQWFCEKSRRRARNVEGQNQGGGSQDIPNHFLFIVRI